MFNLKITPRASLSSSLNLYILFCCDGEVPYGPLSNTSLFTLFDREKFGNVSSVCSSFISAASTSFPSTSFPSFHATPLPATLSSNKISQINKSKTDNLKLSVSEELLPSKYDSTDVAFL